MKPVAVIGGGITGLTAAFRLREQGIPVALYESGDRVGGAIQTTTERGYLAEYGPNTVLETSPQIGELIADLGLTERRWYSDPGAAKNFIIRDGKLQPLPTSPGAFALTPLFSLSAKLRLAMEPFIRTPAKSADEALSDFVIRRLGREFLDYAINPFVSGIYAGDPAKLSVKYAFPKLHAIEERYGSLILGQFLGARERKKRKEVPKDRAKKISFDHGLQVLTDTLQAKLGEAVHLRSPVAGIKQHSSGWTVRVKTAAGLEESHEHSAVLLTAPAHKLAGIAIDSEPFASLAKLGEIPHPPVARVVLGFRREDVAHSLEGFGFLVPEVEKLSILGTTFSSTLFPGRAPQGHVTLTSFVGGFRNPELALADADSVIECTQRDLRRVLGATGKPTYVHHFLYPKAIPQYNVGFDQFSTLMNDIESRLPGLFFAGNYRNGISLGNSIVAGQEIAGRIASFTSTLKSQEAAV